MNNKIRITANMSARDVLALDQLAERMKQPRGSIIAQAIRRMAQEPVIEMPKIVLMEITDA